MNNSSSSRRSQVEVVREDQQSSKKWCVGLRDDVFKRFMSQHSSNSNSNNQGVVNKVFGDEGSLFSPLLFGKFFDPSDAFPLWEFESEILMSDLRSSGLSSVDWFRTDQDYVLKAELPAGIGRGNNVKVYGDQNERTLEICGQFWNVKTNTNTNTNTNKKVVDWRSGNWWEFGFVRRLELPDDSDCKRVEAFLSNNDTLFELKIPRKISTFDHHHHHPDHQPDHVSAKNSDQV